MPVVPEVFDSELDPELPLEPVAPDVPIEAPEVPDLLGSVVLPLPDPMLPVPPKLPVVLVASPGAIFEPVDGLVELVPLLVPEVPGPELPDGLVWATANDDTPTSKVAARSSVLWVIITASLLSQSRDCCLCKHYAR